MGAPARNNNNRLGKGGFAARPWDRWRVGAPGFARCEARCRRTGEPCKNPPVRGRTRCHLHGGLSGRGRRMPRNERVAHNQTVHAVRKAARTELLATCLHPDTPRTMRTFAAKLYPPDIDRFTLALDAYLKGETDTFSWLVTLRSFGLL
jgi:hypothetical protein